MATSSHIRISWFKWHWFNILLKLKFLSGHFGRRAYRDMNSLSNERSIPDNYYEKLKNGMPVGYEHEVGSVYAEFLKANFNVYARLNFYIVMITLAAAVLVAQHLTGVLPAYNNLVLIGGLVLIAALAMLLLIELFINLSLGKRVTQQEHDEAKRWLTATFEDARRRLPFWKFVLILVGLAFEAAAITIIASSYVSDLTRNQALYVGASIGVIGAIMLAFFVHKAGEGLYREHRREEIREVVNEDSANGEKTRTTLQEMSPSINVMIRKKPFLRRHGFMLLALMIIVGLSVAAFYQRAELNLEIISNQVKTQLSASQDLGLLPKEVSDQQKNSQKDIAKEKAERATRGMYAALVILGIIFVAINVMGISFGYQHGFFNEKSEEYYRVVKRFNRQDSHKRNALDINEDALHHVSGKAKWFFSKYHNNLESAAKDFNNMKMAKALKERQPLILEEFLDYTQNKRNADVQQSPTPEPPPGTKQSKDALAIKSDETKPNVIALPHKNIDSNSDKPELS